MKRWILLCMATLFVLLWSETTVASVRKKKKKEEPTEIKEKKPVKPMSKYEKLFKDKSHVATEGGFMTLHKVNGKLYFEMPLKYFNREMLLAAAAAECSSTFFCTPGYKESTPMHIKFVLADSAVYMCNVNAVTAFDVDKSREDVLRRQNYIDAIMEVYKIEAYNPDSTAVVFNMTALFTSTDRNLSPITQKSDGMLSVSASPKAGATLLKEIKAFEDNVLVKTQYAYNASLTIMGAALMTEPVTVNASRSLLLLPEKKMRPRISDLRIGTFLTNKFLITEKEDKLPQYTLANRWRLEPKDVAAYERGELVEPVKPIVYYVDDAFPASWKEAIKEGILRWNRAFEKIGFKNAIQALDFPKDDPSFDPENLKYSCVRYIPVNTENAMGPSWVDPTTGEIINASVLIYNDVIKLINQWRFIQTAQVDPRVRAKKMPDDVVKESLAYVVAHEVGHTLGLLHNMSASHAYPVDSLRSASFTRKYGTTASIMDYARFNYVAQPTDKDVQLTPPDLGAYDEFAIKWLYSYFPGERDAYSEAKILENWVDEKVGDPVYRYGRQQMETRFDPSAIEEDLGDDAMKAGDYGIKNLKYILAHMNDWITGDEDASHRANLYNEIMMQYFRYLQNVVYNVGGIYLADVKEGTPGKRFEAVPRDLQRKSVKWVLSRLKDCEWIDNKAVTDKFGVGVPVSSRVRVAILGNLLIAQGNVLLSSSVSANPYRLSEYMEDVYSGVWESAIQNRKVTPGDKALQTTMMTAISNVIAPKDRAKGLFGLTGVNSFAPSLDEICLYGLDESGLINRFKDELDGIEAEYGKGFVATQMGLTQLGKGYGWQKSVKTASIDDTRTHYIAVGMKLKNLLANRVQNAPDKASREHYQAMLFQLNTIFEGKK